MPPGRVLLIQRTNVKFIQVSFKVNGKHANCPGAWKGKHNKVISGWVSASSEHIDAFRYYAEVFKKYPGIQASKATGWMIPPNASL